eukprot:GEMP01067041.1.p2 GENE.GEMP01067041.1~~GEMP01067041.1.p2  ORF type:complete len:109 (+),score=19.95 GEMP01067041.1:25-327(+)
MSAVARFRPLADRVLVQKFAQQAKTSTGVFLPETAKQSVNQAKVISTGPGRIVDGEMQKVEVKAGDVVVIPEYGGMNIKFDNDDYQIFREEDIVGLVRDE